MEPVNEGKLPIDGEGNSIYYRFAGRGGETMVCLHGGPGQGQGYLKVMEDIQVENLRLLLYDQLGSGKSDPGRNVTWRVERFVAELETVRKKLQLGRIHLYGHSWGGMLAQQYAIDFPANVKSLILSNTGPNMSAIMGTIQQLQSKLPEKHYKSIIKATSGRAVDEKDLDEAKLEFNAQYLRRETPFEINDSKEKFKMMFPATRESYGPAFNGLWGEDRFGCGCAPCNGPLLDWNVTDKLDRIKGPTLILCGMYDEITPELHLELARRIPDNEFVIFGNSSHFITQEKEHHLYLAVIENFMRRMLEKSKQPS